MFLISLQHQSYSNPILGAKNGDSYTKNENKRGESPTPIRWPPSIFNNY